MILRHFACAGDFFLRQLAQPVQVPDIAAAEQIVSQHGDQGRSKHHGEPKIDPVMDEPLHNPEQRDVALRYGLVKPGLLEKVFVLGMPHEREMRVENKGQVPWAHAFTRWPAGTVRPHPKLLMGCSDCGFRIADFGFSDSSWFELSLSC